MMIFSSEPHAPREGVIKVASEPKRVNQIMHAKACILNRSEPLLLVEEWLAIAKWAIPTGGVESFISTFPEP